MDNFAVRSFGGGALTMVAAPSWTEVDGLLREPRLTALGLKHGFTTRKSGNMKDVSRRREAAAQLGLPEPLTLKQVHGITIHDGTASNAGLEGDGWILSKPGVTVGVYVADCVPLYLWSHDGKAAGVFHAGWRGTAKHMAKSAVAAFNDRLGIPASKLSAAMGPHIGPCCYKVGPELEKDFPESSFVRRDGAVYLDLAAETRRQLTESGVSAENIGAPAMCTASNPNELFSYRRDKQDARLLALLSLDLWPS
ncbi:MAG: polyphenol oxidase family protein [Elusimicrobiota bacterium]